METTEVLAPALLSQLVSKHHAQWVDADTIPDWLAVQEGDAVLLFAGDPVRFPEAMDVAVVLPELQQVSAKAGKPFAIGVAVPEGAEALAKKYGSQRWPTLMFFRSGAYVTTVSGMHDWSDYVELVAQALAAPISRAPTIGIPVVSADGNTGSACH